MQVRDGMSKMVLTVGPTTRSARRRSAMAKRRVGAAVVVDPEAPGLASSPSATSCSRSARAGPRHGAGRGPPHLGPRVRRPGLVAREAAAAMVRGGFRHLVVIDEGEATGVSRSATWCGAGPTTGRAARCLSRLPCQRLTSGQPPNRHHQRIIRPPRVRGEHAPGLLRRRHARLQRRAEVGGDAVGGHDHAVARAPAWCRTSRPPAATSRARRRTGSGSRRSRRGRGRLAPAGPPRCRCRSR